MTKTWPKHDQNYPQIFKNQIFREDRYDRHDRYDYERGGPPSRNYRGGRGGGGNGNSNEDVDGVQPVMMSFKAFLGTQDDSISDEDAVKKYAEYKLEFKRQQLNEFFVTHKDEEWWEKFQIFTKKNSYKVPIKLTKWLKKLY